MRMSDSLDERCPHYINRHRCFLFLFSFEGHRTFIIKLVRNTFFNRIKRKIPNRRKRAKTSLKKKSDDVKNRISFLFLSSFSAEGIFSANIIPHRKRRGFFCTLCSLTRIDWRLVRWAFSSFLYTCTSTR